MIVTCVYYIVLHFKTVFERIDHSNVKGDIEKLRNKQKIELKSKNRQLNFHSNIKAIKQ